MNKRFAAWFPSAALIHICSFLVVLPALRAHAQAPILVETLGGVEVWSVPEASPQEGFVASTIILRGVDPGSKLVTFENIAISGDLVQTWLPRAFGGPPGPTPFVDSPGWGALPSEWVTADSHILISPDMVGGGAGGSHGGLVETNDMSDPGELASLLPRLVPNPSAPSAVTGIGGIAMSAPTDAFFLNTPFQTNEVSFAYVVAPTASTGAAGEVFLTVGVLGEGFINSGDPGGASFGFNGNDPVAIPFVPVIPLPRITLTADHSLAVFGESITLSAVATASVDIVSVEFFADNEPIPTCSFVALPYECVWTPELPGSYNMTARATDENGGVGNSRDWLLQVVPDPPLITLTAESSTILTGESLTLSAEATARVGEIASVDFFANNELIPNCSFTATPYECEWTPNMPGPYNVKARATDSFGGSGTSDVRSVLVEPGDPLVTLTADRTSLPRGYSVTLSVGATARSGEIASVEFFSDAEPIPGCSLVEVPYKCVWTPDMAGSYNITARATDDLGRASDSGDTQLNVVPPFAWIVSDGVEVVFTPDPEPLLGGDLLGGTLSIESLDGSEIRTFGEMLLRDLHHVGVQQLLGVGPTATVADHRDPDHARYDSHLLITRDMIGGAVGDVLQETGFDDPTAVDPAGVQDRIPDDMFGNPAQTYSGDLDHGNGAFFLLSEFQADSIDFARLVGRPGDVSAIRFEVLGDFSGRRLFDFEMGWTLPEGIPPTIQFDAPAGLIEFGNAVTLSASASDSDGDLALVEFFDNGMPIAACSFTAVPFECTWTPTGGPHKLRAIATDENGNRVVSESARISVESFSPLVTLVSDFSPIVAGDSVTLAANAVSPVGSIELVEFFANDELITCSLSASAFDRYLCEWTPNMVGSYDITARATDDSDRFGDAGIRRLVVESNPPVITLFGASSTIVEGDSLTLSADATARVGEIASVEFLANDEPIPNCSLTATPYECEWTPNMVGSYNVTARATDSFGGFRTSNIRSVLVESGAPLVTLTADRTSLARGYSVTLSADATAKSGEIVSVEFFSDTEPIPDCSFVALPYECVWTPDREGSYNVTARATDDLDRVGDSGNTQVDVAARFASILSDGLQVVFTPDPEPLLDGDLLGGTISIESVDGSKVATFGGISMHDLHHVGIRQLVGISPTVTAADHRDPGHALYDSHLLITPDMIGGSAGDMLQETGFDDPNAVDPAGVQDRIPADMFGNPANTYLGDIIQGDGAFFLDSEFQTDSIDFARLVGRPGYVSALRFEVLGEFSGPRIFDFEIGWTLPEGNPPMLQFDAPTGLIEAGVVVTLSASASDSDGDLALVEFFDNGVPIPVCAFTEGPFECAWTPTGGSHRLRATATDENGNRVLSEAHVSVESDSAFDVDLPRDEDGNIIVDGEFFTPGAFGGPPSPIRPGFPVQPLRIVLPVVEGGLVTLVAIDEIADDSDRFSYVGDPPPLQFESPFVVVGPFDFEPPLFTGEFSAMYELTFDDGSRVITTLSASVIPEPATFGGSILCLLGLIVYRRKRRYVDHDKPSLFYRLSRN